MWHWLAHHFGTDNGAGGYYLWWSGMGANFGELTVIGAVIGLYYRHNCHVKGCWRISRHPVEGTPFIVCRKHHPAVPDVVTAEHVAEAHQEAGTKESGLHARLAKLHSGVTELHQKVHVHHAEQMASHYATHDALAREPVKKE